MNGWKYIRTPKLDSMNTYQKGEAELLLYFCRINFKKLQFGKWVSGGGYFIRIPSLTDWARMLFSSIGSGNCRFGYCCNAPCEMKINLQTWILSCVHCFWSNWCLSKQNNFVGGCFLSLQNFVLPLMKDKAFYQIMERGSLWLPIMNMRTGYI